MDEEIVETGIYEYGSDVVNGMPKDQKIKWRDHTTTSRIHILEEFEPIGKQKLKQIRDIKMKNLLPQPKPSSFYGILPIELAEFDIPSQFIGQRVSERGSQE